ncbi:MAG TPA: hypothetical protein VH599_10185 [Ktedonobacterales bacterium]|jgi:hypothetical protein
MKSICALCRLYRRRPWRRNAALSSTPPFQANAASTAAVPTGNASPEPLDRAGRSHARLACRVFYRR